MILDDNGMDSLIQETANRSNAPQEVYRRKDGSVIHCPKGMINEVRKYLPVTERLSYVKTINPSTWPKDDNMH